MKYLLSVREVLNLKIPETADLSPWRLVKNKFAWDFTGGISIWRRFCVNKKNGLKQEVWKKRNFQLAIFSFFFYIFETFWITITWCFQMNFLFCWRCRVFFYYFCVDLINFGIINSSSYSIFFFLILLPNNFDFWWSWCFWSNILFFNQNVVIVKMSVSFHTFFSPADTWY